MNVKIEPKKLTEEVYHIIRNDIPLREKIAKQLLIDTNSVYTHAVRKSKSLQKPFILEIIKNHTGLNKIETDE
jgi:hypothetical protein